MRRGWRLACHPYRTMCSTSICLDGATRSALLMQARNGDLESLAKLILPYAPGLYLGALRMTRNPADAEDVRQDAFLKVMTRLEQFAGTPGENRDDLHAWVSRIAANASIDVIRKRRDGKIFSLEEPNGAGDETLGSNVTACEDNPEERFARCEMRKLMADAIAQLTRSEEHTSELQSRLHLVCPLLLEKKKKLGMRVSVMGTETAPLDRWHHKPR